MTHKILFPLAFVALLACSSAPVSTPIVEKPAGPPPPPQCMAGCMVQLSGQCAVTARSMDNTTTGEETIECDPRCCQEGAKTDSSGNSINDPDNDGIAGDADQCPDKPEDFDEFEDRDGCPDEDNDKDGILDVDDVCRDDPEVKNGFEDDDGCPDAYTPPTQEEAP
jgi:hypothetical protein